MNLPNAITVARFALTLAYFVILAHARPERTGLLTLALAVFLVDSITDVLDGWLARRRGLETSFGRFADPFVDKVLICGSYVLLIDLAPASGDTAPVEAWMAVAVIAREIMVTCLRSFLELKGIAFASSFEGKLKMILQCVNIAVLLGYLAFWGGLWPVRLGADLLTAGVICFTLVTGVLYVWRARVLYSRHGA